MAFDAYCRKGIDALSDAEKKALTVSNDNTGGYLAPPEYVRELLKQLPKSHLLDQSQESDQQVRDQYRFQKELDSFLQLGSLKVAQDQKQLVTT